jgi:hypothetical protein
MWLAVARSSGPCLLLTAFDLAVTHNALCCSAQSSLGRGRVVGVVDASRLVQPVLSTVCVRLARKMRKQNKAMLMKGQNETTLTFPGTTHNY